MQTISNKYYAKVPIINGFDGDYFWSELDAKTLTTACDICNSNGLMSEIGIQQEVEMKVISAKDPEGKWEVVNDGNEQERLAKDQTQYWRNGKLFSGKDWYESCFQHEKKNNKTIKDTQN